MIGIPVCECRVDMKPRWSRDNGPRVFVCQRCGRRERPVLDEQEWERINEAIMRSLHERVPVRLRMYDPLEECIVEGVVERVDQAARRIKVDGEWFAIDDIIGVDRG